MGTLNRHPAPGAERPTITHSDDQEPWALAGPWGGLSWGQVAGSQRMDLVTHPGWGRVPGLP